MTRSDATSWRPDWATHPGEHLAEHMKERGLSHGELAELAGMAPELVSALVARAEPVTPEVAKQLDRALGLKADI